MDKKGNTTNAILVILLVIVVGFVVWYVTMRNTEDTSGPGVEVNLGGNDSGSDY